MCIKRLISFLASLTLAIGAGAVGTPEAHGHGVESPGVYETPAVREKSISFFDFISSAEATARVRIDESGGYMYISADGIPDHATGSFPNRGNPNTISSQHYSFRVPLVPQKTGRVTPMRRQPVGIALNGVVFDPGTAEAWNNDLSSGWNIEALGGGMDLGLDRNNAHVQPNGAYHYHGLPVGILEKFPYKSEPVFLGYAADGFPIYGPYGYSDPNDPASAVVELRSSYRIKSGTRPSGPGGRYDGTYVQDYEYVAGLGDLDQCNGRFAVTPDHPQGAYHYVLTAAFPFIPRCFMGEPDRSFMRRGPRAGGPPEGGPRPQGGQQVRGGPPAGGHPDLNVAAQKLGIPVERLRRALGPPPPDLRSAAAQLGISEQELRRALVR